MAERSPYPSEWNSTTFSTDAINLVQKSNTPETDALIALLTGASPTGIHSVHLLLTGEKPDTIIFCKTPYGRECFQVGTLAEKTLKTIAQTLMQANRVRNNFEGELPTSSLTSE